MSNITTLPSSMNSLYNKETISEQSNTPDNSNCDQFFN